MSPCYRRPANFFFTTEHNTYNRRRSNKLFRLIERKVYSRYHRIICISSAAARALQHWLPETGHKTRVIYNGKDLKPYMHVQTLCKREKGFNEDTPLVISVASLSKQKDHVTLIKAIAHLQNVHLLIVGDGSLKTKLHPAFDIK